MYAFLLGKSMLHHTQRAQSISKIVAMITIGVLLLTEVNAPLKNAERLDLILRAIEFGALYIWQSNKPNVCSTDRLFEYLGERSYSIYLLHLPVIIFSKAYILIMYSKLETNLEYYAFFVSALVVIGVLLILAEVTYREMSGIKWRRRIISNIRAN